MYQPEPDTEQVLVFENVIRKKGKKVTSEKSSIRPQRKGKNTTNLNAARRAHTQ